MQTYIAFNVLGNTCAVGAAQRVGVEEEVVVLGPAMVVQYSAWRYSFPEKFCTVRAPRPRWGRGLGVLWARSHIIQCDDGTNLFWTAILL